MHWMHHEKHGCEQCRWMPGTIHMLQAMVNGLQYELHVREIRIKQQDKQIARLHQQIEELKKQARAPDAGETAIVPPFVKPNRPKRRRRHKPGRKQGHEPALRVKPRRIDHHQEVALARDQAAKPLCPHCQSRLNQLRRHKRLVEDLSRSSVKSTCYHTHSGRCPNCNRRVESRAPEQPPAANVPHGQLGINALATAAILRIRHRLPYRQLAQVLLDLPGLSLSPAGIVKQIKRVATWLESKYQDLIRRMRASPHVHADETGWRIDGRNFWLWAFTDPTFTLYHVDESRGSKVPLKLLGKAFGGTVIADFYSAYDRVGASRQRCLPHLMREIKDLKAADPSFADCPLSLRLLRWCKEALRLKKQWNDIKAADYDRLAKRLEDRLGKLIESDWQMHREHPEALRLCKRLSKHRDELTRFLWDRDLEGTNNAAERALRPAVVMRKITGGSRSRQAAVAWAKLASLIRTADQRGLGVFDATKKLIMDYWASAER